MGQFSVEKPVPPGQLSVEINKPMLSRNSNWVLQLKISRAWRPWAVWSVGFCGVRYAIYSTSRARGTAKPECFGMFRVADRPATHAGSKLHKFNLN